MRGLQMFLSIKPSSHFDLDQISPVFDAAPLTVPLPTHSALITVKAELLKPAAIDGTPGRCGSMK